MRRSLALSAVAAVSACTLLAGCGSSSSGGNGGGGGGSNNSTAAPKTEFTDAVHALTSGSSLTTTLGLDTTSANLIKITGEHGGTPVTQSQADLITNAKLSIAVQAPSGKTLADVSAGDGVTGSAVRVTGSTGGTTYFTFTTVDKNLYVQLDLKGILNAAGKSSTYTGITSQAASLPAFAQDFLAGKTIEIPAATISALTGLLQGSAQGQNGASAVPKPSQIAGLVTGLETAILDNLTVTRTATGTTDTLELTGNVRTIATDIMTAVATAIPAVAGQINSSSASSAPDRDVKVEASVTGGALSKLEFDVGQFSPHQADTLPITASFSQAPANITAPSGATTVNFQDLVSFFTAFSGVSGSSSSSSGSSG